VDPAIKQRGPSGERGAPAYNGGLGALPPAGSRGGEVRGRFRISTPKDGENLVHFEGFLSSFQSGSIE